MVVSDITKGGTLVAGMVNQNMSLNQVATAKNLIAMLASVGLLLGVCSTNRSIVELRE